MPDTTHDAALRLIQNHMTDRLIREQKVGAIAVLQGLISPLQDIAAAVMPHDTHRASGVLLAVDCVIQVRDRLIAEQDA